MPAVLSLQSLRDSLDLARQRAASPGNSDIWALLWLALAITCLGIGLALAAGGYHGGFHTLQAFTQALLPDDAWAWITRLGDARVLLVLSMLFVRRRPEIFWAMLVGALIAALYSRGLKLHFDALRPPAVLAAGDFHLIGKALKHHSFPSGHTLSAFLYAGVLLAFSRQWYERAVVIGLALLVGLSRVALGIHWPQDIVAGAFGGLIVAALAIWITRYWQAGLAPRVHLGLLALPLVAVPSLMIAEAGNPPAPELVSPLVVLGLIKLGLDYRDLVTPSYNRRI